MDSFNCLMSTFSIPFISNWYYNSNESLAYEYILSTSDRLYSIWFSNTFVLPDPESSIIKFDKDR